MSINVTITTTLPVKYRTVLPTTVDTSTVSQSSSFAGTVSIGQITPNYTYEFWEAGSANRKTVSIPSNAANPYSVDLSVVGSVVLPSAITLISQGGTSANNSSSAMKNLLPTYQPGRFLYTDGTNISWSSTANSGGGGGVTDPLVIGSITINGTGSGPILNVAGNNYQTCDSIFNLVDGAGSSIQGDNNGSIGMYPSAGGNIKINSDGTLNILSGDSCYLSTDGGGGMIISANALQLRSTGYALAIGANYGLKLFNSGGYGYSFSDGSGLIDDGSNNITLNCSTLAVSTFPTSDPANGKNTLWMDAITRIVKVGT